jgi:hypothetical protein
MGLIAGLKRRNAIRMAGLYLVGAWLVTQIAGTLLPMFGAPAWLARVVIVLAVGFMPASAENLRIDPVWDALRADPGFKALLTAPAKTP